MDEKFYQVFDKINQIFRRRSKVILLKFKNETIVDLTEIRDQQNYSGNDFSTKEEENAYWEFLEKLTETMVNKENSLIETYIFDQKRIRYIRNQNNLSEDEFIIIDRKLNERITYFTNKEGEKKFSRQPILFNVKKKEWHFEFRIEEFQSIRKNILGFDCY